MSEAWYFPLSPCESLLYNRYLIKVNSFSRFFPYKLFFTVFATFLIYRFYRFKPPFYRLFFYKAFEDSEACKNLKIICLKHCNAQKNVIQLVVYLYLYIYYIYLDRIFPPVLVKGVLKKNGIY